MTTPTIATNNSSLPPVPDGWKAEWSVQYNRWYYLNLSTDVSQWDCPTLQHHAPTYSQPDTSVQPLAQTYPPPPQFQRVDGDVQEALGADGDRGIIGETVGDGLLELANGLHFEQNTAPGGDGSQFGQTSAGAPTTTGLSGTPHVSYGASLGTAPADTKPPAPIYRIPASSDNRPPGSPYGVSGDSPASINSESHPGISPSQIGTGGSIAGLPPALAVGAVPPPKPNVGKPIGPPPPPPPGSPPDIIPAGMAPNVNKVPSPPLDSPPAKTGENPSGIVAVGVLGAEPRLYIHCAAYGDKDVTKEVRTLVTLEQSLQLKRPEFISHFGDPDPWPGVTKSFSVVYSYGERPWELIAGSEWDGGTFDIIPHQPLDTERMAFIQDKPGKLVALVWGFNNGLMGGEGPVAKKEKIETLGEFPVNNGWMGGNGYDRLGYLPSGIPKAAIAYYRAEDGVVKFTSGREGGTCRMPWNPLAKWT
ncbi:hypothetical protein L207DRAFT_579420 [Hyaloscypha variabilis F]|uniref:WW domain-containing protein n=1 Tax=Hyaloscypha variabilis (strain UAMH 11265 / GT02V1 / F) TaxID=1149755 RepID=A0A2J6S126_HYAVF|nr:hypothetical protein L207DRAFT_579420 [Hyaloscypha variabilis F]